MNYKVEGNIGGVRVIPRLYGQKDVYILVNKLFDATQAPVLLEVFGQLEHYVQEVGNTDFEERYMTKRFTYDSFCTLVTIEVLNKNGSVVKTVEIDTPPKQWAQWIQEDV
ncbi:MAG: hypothetical protein NC132_03090 [Corallococcus sp.]|nr:hypothetical protein [Corallococcus sp.]MCM1359092.1 hypothetical protein [Corallococcus sp.]MCM1395081.1 hypothetical protein [Corallococcus sp.]